MVAYWDKRLEIFGPERAFLPLTIRGSETTDSALQGNDLVALQRGVVRLLPEKADPGGRNILFVDPSRTDRSKYSTLEKVRAVWYIMHVALEDDEDTQCKGIIMLLYPHCAKLAQFDRNLAKHVIGSIRGCLPLRLSAVHFCPPPAFFQVIFPVIKLLFGERLRKRINIFFGSQEHVLQRLEQKHGLSRQKLPTELGGSTELDHAKWVEDRRFKEQASS